MPDERGGDRHAKDQLNVRFPPEVRARLKDGAERHGETQTEIVVRGTVAELDRLDRLDGIAAISASSPVPVAASQPQPHTTRTKEKDQ